MSKIYDQLKEFTNWALGITVSVAFFLMAKDDLLQLLREQPVIGVLAALLLIATVARLFIYVYTLRTELDLLATAFDPEKVKTVSGSVLWPLVLLSLFMGTMIAFATNILVWTAMATLFASFDIYGQATVIRNIGAFILADAFPEERNEAYCRALFSYYFDKPLLLRNALLVVLFNGSFVLALSAYFTENPAFAYSAYALAIVTTVGSEAVIHMWRRERTAAIEQSLK